MSSLDPAVYTFSVCKRYFADHRCMHVQYKPLVFDAVYTPLDTRLLKEAAGCGCKTVNGLEMFVGQAAKQFQHFTGKEPPVATMRSVVLASLSK